MAIFERVDFVDNIFNFEGIITTKIEFKELI